MKKAKDKMKEGYFEAIIFVIVYIIGVFWGAVNGFGFLLTMITMFNVFILLVGIAILKQTKEQSNEKD